MPQPGTQVPDNHRLQTQPMTATRQTAATAGKPRFIGPGQTAVTLHPELKLANYYASTPDVVFNKKLTQKELAALPVEYLPLAASSRSPVDSRALKQMQKAIRQMTEGPWQSVYIPTKPGDGNNSGNGMSGIFLQRADLEVVVKTDNANRLTTSYRWPSIRRYQSRQRVQPENYNYSLVYHHYRKAFEAAFDLMIFSMCDLDSSLQDVMTSRKQLGLYFGLTDYYGDPDILPPHLLRQVEENNPNPESVTKEEYLQLLREYRKKPILPGNYHTDGVEKNLDVQGIFTILNQGCTGGETLVRRRGISRHSRARKKPVDVTVRLNTPEGHAGLWVPSWGRTEVEHTPGPIQGGHRTIIVFGLDSLDPDLVIKESETRRYYGSHYETRAWDKRRWFSGGAPIEVPDKRLWNAGW